jgi:DsrE/DsrF-like family.
VGKIREAGVEVLACKACTDSYGVSDILENMEITVKYMGVGLTEFLMDENTRVITI